ncbi:MAG: amidase family protein, partial [Fretibacterium sp.]
VGEANKDAMKGYESDLYTLPVNMAGLPGLSFFTGYSPSGLPVGLQLVGPRWSDGRLLDVGLTLEGLLGSPRIAKGGL